MLLIYTPKITKRINYIFNLYFVQLLATPYELTSNADLFIAHTEAKFSYASNPFGQELFFQSSDLLFKTGIEGQDLNYFLFEKNAAFYPTYHSKSALPFDPFAAAFYLVTRYEEYLPYMRDRFGRFEAGESFAGQKEFLRKPVVNIWAQKIKEILTSHFPELSFAKRQYQFTPTIDIDSAYAYKYKGAVRTIGGIVSALSKLELREISERIRVILGLRKDPFDTYNYQLMIQRRYQLQPIYFILLADYGRLDKNLPVTNRHFQVLIKSLSDYSQVGIHPSVASGEDFSKLKIEIDRLNRILNREITQSRQHFLRLNFPSTYRNLIQLDITDDYTMGYASEPGFRAGICDPFYFYDLDMETVTKLMIHPFQLMEGTLKDYMNKTPEQSLAIMKLLIDEVKAVDGTFISLWHNESLSDQKRWAGWRKVYEDMIAYAVP